MEVLIIILIIVVAAVSSKKKEQARKAEQEARRRAQGGQPYTPPPRAADAMPSAAFEEDPTPPVPFPAPPAGQPSGSMPYFSDEGGGPAGSLAGASAEGLGPRGSMPAASGEGMGMGGSLGGSRPVSQGPLHPSFTHTVQPLTESTHRHMETSLTGDVPCPPSALVKPRPQRPGRGPAKPAPQAASGRPFGLSFAPDDVRRGILYAEILSKPRALRGR